MNRSRHQILQHLYAGLWIRIRINPHSFASWIRIRIQYADTDPGGETFSNKNEKEIGQICKFIQIFKSKFAQASLFLTYKQSLMFFKTKENSS